MPMSESVTKRSTFTKNFPWKQFILSMKRNKEVDNQSSELYLPSIETNSSFQTQEHEEDQNENQFPKESPKTQMFPPIAKSTQKQTTHLSNMNSPAPRMTSHALSAEVIIPESGVVVGTRNLQRTQKSQNSQTANFEEWKQQELLSLDQDVQKTKLGWENDIARHILSLYATTNALKNIKESNSLLDFVGEKPKGTQALTLRPDGAEFNDDDEKMEIATKKPSFLDTRPKKPKAIEKHSDTIEEGEDEGEYANETNDSHNVTEKKKKKKRKMKKKTKAELEAEELERQHRTSKAEQDAKNQEFINQIISKLENTMKSSKQKDKFRVTNTIKTIDGREVVVRGSPKCFPIWFVPSGDIYVDWTKLPGGKRLQSHLSVLYENQYYSEYLNIIQTMLVTYWREKNYGKQEFSLGNFGKSDTALSGNSSANNSCPSSRSSRQKTSSSSASSMKPSSSSSSLPSSSAGGGGNHKKKRKDSSDQQGLTRVDTANTYFSQHYGEDQQDPSSSSQQQQQQNRHRVGSSSQRVTFYDNLLDEKIDSSIRSEIENKVEMYNFQKGSYDFQDDQKPNLTITTTNLHNFTNSMNNNNAADNNYNQVEDDIAFQKLTIKDIEEFWKQLILTAIAIGILNIEKKQFDKGMKYFILADDWAKNDELMPSAIVRKLFRAYVKDAMSFYFFKRDRFIAALAYSNQAMEVLEKYCDYDPEKTIEAIGICLLHIAATYSLMSKFKDAHKVLFQFLAMVENGRLSLQDATPKQLCLVAVGYHNLAVVQLKLAMPDLACKSSQNARKIARLCLAYSNRWIDIFQYTHEIAISDMKYELQSKTIDEITPQQMLIIKELAEALFSIDSQVA